MNLDLLKNNPKYLGQFKEKTLLSLPLAKEGEFGYCVDTNKIMKYDGIAWSEVSIEEGKGLELPLYDLNKSIMIQVPDLPKEKINEAITTINTFDFDCENKYYMLYGKEISYFTLFVRDFQNEMSLGDIVIDCLKYVGNIKAIDLTDAKDAIEIWVSDGENATCLYLFPYDNGIVSYGA